MLLNELNWNNLIAFPIVGLLQFFPLLIAVFLFYNRNSKYNLKLAMIFSVIEIMLSFFLYSSYQIEPVTQSSQIFQFAESFNIIGAFAYHAAVDGVSISFILLTTILSLLILIYSRSIPLENPKLLPAFVFAVEACLISQFSTLNLLWFLLASTAEILLVAYLVWYWATSPEIDLAISKYLQFMGFSLSLFFVAILLLGWNYSDHNAGLWSFDLFDLYQVEIPFALQSVIFFLMFYALAIRIPIFPFHGWLPTVVEHGTVVLAPVFLLGLKVGIYALVRFVFPLFPEVITSWHKFIVAFAVMGIFYAALLALMQVNLRRLLAFAVISHSGILIIGLFTLNPMAFKGSIMLSINFGFATSGLLIMTGFIFWRTRTMLLSKLGNLFDLLPFVGFCFLLAGLSIVGMPGTPGFDAVHLVLEASIRHFGALVTIAAAIANVLAAGFLLWSFQRAFLSKPSFTSYQLESYTKKLHPETRAEKILAISIIGMLLLAGFYSSPWLQLIDQPLNSLGELFEHAKHAH
ncbi:MAG: proton-conducting transporter membrane subunit [Pseudomonadota bacterium]